MKSSDEVISEFNEYVNMTADELEEWLKSGDSNSAGWPKDDAEGDGESVGHDSGRKIVEILKENPDKTPDKYTDEQVEHMRKVVAYCKRHLAQEAKGNSEKSEEEVKKTKSYASLKNWGHDFLKAQSDTNKADNGEEEEDKEDTEAKEEEAAQGEDDAAKAGDKRKQTDEQNGSGSSKKRETRQGEGTAARGDEETAEVKNGGAAEGDTADGDEEEEEVSEEDPDEDGGSKATKGPKKGDTVSWKWGNGQPEGKVLDVKGEKTTITTKKGNEVSRNGKPEDPAVVIDTGKSTAVKSNHELN